jgi:glycosyltransferase involved in cell wall biosynthesis
MILFAWRRLPPPGFIGGAEISEGLVAAALAEAGVEVVFVGATQNPRDWSEPSLPWLTELLGHAGIENAVHGTSVEYVWRGVRCMAVRQQDLLCVVRSCARQADALWTSQEDCGDIKRSAGDLPTASYAHSVSAVGLLSAQIGARWVFVPSLFVQDRIRAIFGIEAHLLRPPLSAPQHRRAGGHSEGHVLFVNPLPQKGIDTATALAHAHPHQRFIFVETWHPISDGVALPVNVRLLPRLPTLDHLYADARLLLVPSVIEDACPRVILEAGLHGVPTLGSTLGGIPELIADSANVLDPVDTAAWLARSHELLNDPATWSDASRAQLARVAALWSDPAATLAQVGFPLVAHNPT